MSATSVPTPETITLTVDELRRLKFALVFQTGNYRGVIDVMGRVSKKRADVDAVRHLAQLQMKADEIAERYSNEVDLEAIINGDSAEWDELLGVPNQKGKPSQAKQDREKKK